MVSCKKDLTDTDYGQLIGKWKLVYTLKLTSSTSEKVYPPDNYELDFNRNGKLYKYKNGDCESKSKVKDCNVQIDDPSLYKHAFLYLKDRSNAIEMGFTYYSTGYDTLMVFGYYPVENDPNLTPYRYGHYYVRE
jgi:hypothetical protein